MTQWRSLAPGLRGPVDSFDERESPRPRKEADVLAAEAASLAIFARIGVAVRLAWRGRRT